LLRGKIKPFGVTMSKTYQPPYSITPAIIRLIAEISEKLGSLSTSQEHEKQLHLRRLNRIRTIQGSLAIEGNTLNEKQITAILDGKKIVAPPREIQEARNAIAAYEQFHNWQPTNQKHLLKAHRILMQGLIDDAGRYRSGNVGVMDAEQLIHMAPPANRVSKLMGDLLQWLNQTEQHPLISSSIFHYEFEFIHPFADGNGRMGRLWQTLILSQWNSFCADMPVESMIHLHQNEYYQAINQSTNETDSAPFVEFILKMILETLTPQVTPQVEQLLTVLKGTMSREQLQDKLALKDRKSFRKRYLLPALNAKLIEMTIPDKPSSKLQQYRQTSLGKMLK